MMSVPINVVAIVRGARYFPFGFQYHRSFCESSRAKLGEVERLVRQCDHLGVANVALGRHTYFVRVRTHLQGVPLV